MKDLKINPPKWFWVIGVLALLWNLLGVMAFITELLLDPEQLEILSEKELNFYETRPVWVTIAYALAVFGGTLGAIALLLRKKIAKSFFILSLTGILAQQFYIFFLSDALNLLGLEDIFLPLAVIVIGFLLFWYTKYCISKGWVR
jgi:hypothetical protein